MRGLPPQGWNHTSPVAGSRYTAPDRTRASAPVSVVVTPAQAVEHPDLYRGLLHDVAAVEPVRVVPDRYITHDDARPLDRFRAFRPCPATHGRGDAEDDDHRGRRRTGHQHPAPANPSASSAHVVGQRRGRHLEPLGHRVQPLDQVGLLEAHAPSPSRTVVPNSAASARRNAARASLVWLFTVPALMPRSAAVSSTLRPR